jgi:hypothetical protein
MDLAMVKQEQGETLCKYMRRFFDKRATLVDSTNSGMHSRVLQSHRTLTTRKARRRTMETTTTSRNLTRPSTSSSAGYPAGGSKRLPVEKS